LWHSSLQLPNHYSLGRMEHAAEPVVSEPMAIAIEKLKRYKTTGISHIPA